MFEPLSVLRDRSFATLGLLMILSTAPGALADCGAGLAITGTPPQVTLTGTTTGTCVPPIANPVGMQFFRGESALSGWLNCPQGAVTCEVPFVWNTEGLDTGTYSLWVSTGCGQTEQNQCVGHTGGTGSSLSINSERIATPSFDGPDPSGHGTTTIDYTIRNAFPNHRFVNLYRKRPDRDPETIHSFENLETDSGTLTTTALSTTCLASGVLYYYAGAFNPSGIYFSSQQAIQVNGKPVVSAAVVPDATDPNFYTVKVHYRFPNTDEPARRSLRADWLTSPGFNGRHIENFDPQNLALEGDTSFTVQAEAKAENIRVLGVSCTGEKADFTVTIPERKCCCGNAPACSGDPVRMSSGNMRYSEDDVLPGSEAGRLVRVYDSSEDVRGLFGHGWTTLLDAWCSRYTISLPDDPNPLSSVVVATESNDRFVFSDAGGSWAQSFPSTDAAGREITVSATQVIYTDGGARAQWTYRLSDGRLINRKSLITGRELTITWDANGLPVRADDSWGVFALLFTVDLTSHLVTSVAVENSSISRTYAYTGNDLTSVTVEGATAWRTYAYSSGRLTSVHDALGNLLESHTYNTHGKATDSHGPSGEITGVTYALPGRVTDERVTRVTWASGKTVDYYLRPWAGETRTFEVHGGCGSCTQEDAVYAYDLAGNVVREQNARGYITATQYDTQRRINGRQTLLVPSGCDPATDAAHCRLTPELLMAATLTHSAASVDETSSYGDSHWPSRPTETTTTSARNPAGIRTESWAYDAASGEILIHSVTGWTGIDTATSETHTTATTLYSAADGAAFSPCAGTCVFESAWESLPQPAGLRKEVDGPLPGNSDRVRYVYYPIHAAVPGALRGRLAAVMDAAGLITRFENYNVFGHPQRVVDPNEVVTETAYDSMARVTATTVKAFTGCSTSDDALCATDLVSQRTYATGGGPLATVVRPGGGTTSYAYDARGRLLTITQGSNERIEHTYDVNGFRTGESILALVNGSWGVRRSETTQYDAQGRVTRVTHADNTHVDSIYDDAGLLISVQDENHATPNTLYAYDAAGRIQTVTQTLSTAPGGTIATSYAYNVHGNLVSVTDPNGNVTAYLYDDFGQMLRQTSPVTGTTTYTYDSAGDLLTSTDANGATTTRTYDAAGRVLTSTSVRSGKPAETTTWSYGGDTIAFGNGRLRTMSDPAGTTTYSYDRRGMLRLEKREVTGVATPYETRYRHDADGNRSAISYPSGQTITFGYDAFGRPVTAATASASLVTNASYAPFGPLESLVLGNGTTQTMPHDARYRVTQNKLTSSAGTIAQYDYAYDAAGNITQIHDGTNAAYNRDFAYDDLNRLVTANSGGSLWGSGAYTYDRMGSMLTSTFGSTAFSHSGTMPKIVTATEGSLTRNVTYDAAGNELTTGGVSYSYSSRNLLAAADGLSYDYDGRGVRVTTRVPKVLLRFAPDQLYGGGQATGTVILGEPAPAGGATVPLAGGNASVSVPATVTVAAGQTSATFTATTSAVDNVTTVAVQATFSGSSVSAALVLIPDPRQLLSLTVNPTDAHGEAHDPRLPEYLTATATGTLTLTSPAPAGGVHVTVSCTNDCAPADVFVPASSSSATFSIEGSNFEFCNAGPQFDCASVHNLTAVYIATRSATFTVHTLDEGLGLKANAVTLLGISVAPPAVIGDASVSVTVDLSAAAPEGGVNLSLVSSDPALDVPARVFIPQGQRSITLQLPVASVQRETSIELTAELHGNHQQTTLKLRPLPHKPVSLAFGAGLVTPHSASGQYERYSFYSPELQLLAETDTTLAPAIAYEYVWFAGRPLAQLDIATSTVHWTFADHLGTPLLQTDASAAIDWRAEQEPYGRVHTFRAGTTRHQPLRFPGQEYDDAVGDREYNVFRWYRTGWGRYTQGDPMGPGGAGLMVPYDSGPVFKSWAGNDPRAMIGNTEASSFFDVSLYRYATDNPLTTTDPFGLWAVLCTVHRISAKPLFTFDISKGVKALHCGYIGDCFPSFGYKITAQAEVDAISPPCKECPAKCFFFASVTGMGTSAYKVQKTSQPSCW